MNRFVPLLFIAGVAFAAARPQSPDYSGALYFRSNPSGQTLEKIPPSRVEEEPILLKVTDSEKILYEEGREIKRWVTESTPRGSREKFYEEGKLSRISDYEGAKLIREMFYKGGDPRQGREYLYSGEQLTGFQTLDGTGEVSGEYSLVRGRYGSLRGVMNLRDESMRASFTPPGRSEMLWLDGPTQRFIEYEKGAMKSREIWDDETLLSRENFDWEKGRSVYEEPGEQISRDREYDDENRLIREVSRGPRGKEVRSWVYDEDGLLIRELFRKPRHFEEIRFRYSDSEDRELLRKTELFNGQLKKVTTYKETLKTRELIFQSGVPVLLIFFDQEIPVDQRPLTETERSDWNRLLEDPS